MGEEQNEITVAEAQYAHIIDIVNAEADSLTASMLDVLRRESALETMLEMQCRSSNRKDAPDDFASTEEKRKESWKRLIELLVTMSDFLDQFSARFSGLKQYLIGDETGEDDNSPEENNAKPETQPIGFAA